MAYKQKPGRGNSPKTGNGLPSPLRQNMASPMQKKESPMKMVSGTSAASAAVKGVMDKVSGANKAAVERKRTAKATASTTKSVVPVKTNDTPTPRPSRPEPRPNSTKTPPSSTSKTPLMQELPKKRSAVDAMKAEKRYTPELRKAIEENGRKNVRLKQIESTAKSDSVFAAKKRLSEGGSKASAQLQGNKAANATRQKNNAWNLTVDKGKKVDSGGTTSTGSVSYTRRKPTVEQDVKMARNKDGVLDVAKNARK